MAITNRFSMIDADNNEYEFDDRAFKILNRGLEIELDIIEKSFNPGADFPGIQRDQSSSLEFIYDFNKSTESNFRASLNELIRQARKTLIIRDNVNETETEAILESTEIAYDPGGFNLGSQETFTFKQLTPYWRDIEYIPVSESDITSGLITIINNGYIETPPIITITAREAISKFAIRINETKEGILINDLEFGVAGLNTYIIDNKAGFAELNQINRNQKIKSGTGFFDLQVGINTILLELSGAAEVEFQYKRRYYL